MSMDILSDLAFNQELARFSELDNVFVVPKGQSEHRDFEKPSFNYEYKQIKVNKAENPNTKLNLEQLHQAKPKANTQEQALRSICDFYHRFPFISLANFSLAENFYREIFRNPNNLLNLANSVKQKLQEAFHENDRFGSMVVDSIVKSTHIKLALGRSKLRDVKQYLSFDFDEQNPHSFVVFSKWDWKMPKYELLRSIRPNIYAKKPSKESIEFDSKIWQAFNASGIHRKNLMKTLDCIERNRDVLPDFINEVNKKSLLNLFEKDLISNVSIKTDNHQTVFLDFRTQTGQKIEIKLTANASSLVVHGV